MNYPRGTPGPTSYKRKEQMRAVASVLGSLPVISQLAIAVAFAPAAPKPRTHPDLKSLQEQGYELFQRGRYRAAEEIFDLGLRKATALPHTTKEEAAMRDWSTARFLSNLGSCALATYQYRQAMRTYLASARLAVRSGDYATAAVVFNNIADIYAALEAWPNALAAAERALAWGSRAGGKYAASLKVRAASLRAAAGDFAGADSAFREGIEEARTLRETDPNERKLEAAIKRTALESARNGLGYVYLKRHDLASAAREIAEDLRLRRAGSGRNLDVALRNQGMLLRAQGDLDGASESFRAAAEAARKSSHAVVLMRLRFEQGELQRTRGRLEEAGDEYSAAMDIVRRWRLQMLPADAVRSSSQAELHSIYARFAESRAELFFRTGQAGMAAEALDGLEESRAASLAASPTNLAGWQRRLSPRYGEKLAELQSLEAQLLGDEEPGLVRRRDRLRTELVELEAQSALGLPEQGFEKASLDDVLRRRLSSEDLLLSFHVGDDASYLWAASRDRVQLKKLPPRMGIVESVRAFRDRVRNGADSAARRGASLYSDLFGGFEDTIRRHPRLFLSLDDALFELPFAALVEGFDRGRPVYLIENHDVALLPSAYMLSPAPPGPRETEFLGVGDAVYNRADPRWSGPGRLENPLLPRLAGSAREIRDCARTWSGPQTVLEGAGANRKAVRDAIRNRPAVVHIAAHVLQNRDGRAFVGLSLGPDGRPEHLSAEEIASWPVQARLVVLSGCGSGAGRVLPGAGLMGLTRAWLSAGAASVLASYWPTPDDSGQLFVAFYDALRRDPLQRPAAALRQAQICMLRSATWRAQPKYWAAYFTVARKGH